MKIGIVTTWFDRGAAFVSRQYADVLAKENDIFIFARGGEKYDKTSEYWQVYPVFWGKIFKDSETRIDWSEFKSWIKDNQIDLVIFNEQKDWEIIVDAKKLGIKTIAYIDYYTQETVPFFSLYDGLICNTKRHFSVFDWHPGAFFIPWGTDLNKFDFSKLDQKSEFKRPVFFHSAGMGGIKLRKGTDLLVRAFSEIKTDAELVIHSQVPVNYYKEISELILNNKNITFIEKSVSPPGLYHLGNVYVYPTKLEGIGLTICEALAMGLPVITTDCAPMNEFITHGENGLLVSVDKYISRPDGYYWPESICNLESLKDSLQYIVDNFSEVKTLSANALKSANQHYDWEANSAQLCEIVKNVMESPSFNDENISHKALGYTFSERENVRSLFKAITRKFRRNFLIG
ncbi:glycosyltransferase family 4 protein [Neptunicella sp.]|uniref:glycosyltransferase family 4 protein n=1 Tax=Neptunicella sp. TaxID=2125986 RepID=UPI003F68C46C